MVKPEPETKPEIITFKSRVSPSSINLMLDCPRCFWLEIVKKVHRPSFIFPSLPSGMDKVLKEHFDRFMDKGELPPELKECKDIEGCRLFNDKEKLSVWRNNRVGMQYAKGEFLLKGAVDNILIKNGKLIVLDYKTRGFPLKEDSHEYYQAQMDIYNFLLRKNGHKTEDYAFLLFYYPVRVTETGEVVFDTVLKKIKTNAEDGEKLFCQAIELLEGEIPEASEECEFCKLRENQPFL